MNIGERVRHIYSNKMFGKVVSIPDTGALAGRVEVQWDLGPCYHHNPKFLVDANAGNESFNRRVDFATIKSVGAESPSDHDEAEADRPEDDLVEVQE